MSVFALNIALLFFWGLLFHGRLDPRDGGSKWLIIIISLQLFVFVAASPLINDALNYEMYASLHLYGNAESGWVLFSELVWQIWPDGKALVLASNLVITIAFGCYVWRNSRNIVFSYFIYICLGIWGMTFYILRQTVALALLLFAYECLRRQKKLAFLLLTIAAGMFHQTAFVFLLLLPVSFLRRNVLYHLAAIAAGLVGILFGEQIINSLLSVFRNGAIYSVTELSGVSYFIMLLGFCVFACVVDRGTENKLGCHAIEIAVVLQTLSLYLSNFVRAVQYFAIHLTAVLPNAIRLIENPRVRLIARVAVVLFFLYFYFIVQDCAYPEGSLNWYLDWL